MDWIFSFDTLEADNKLLAKGTESKGLKSWPEQEGESFRIPLE